MAFFKDGFSKLMHAVKGEQEAATIYDGRLSADRFQLHGGLLLGSGNLVPRTLTYSPASKLVAFCTTAGHIRLITSEHEMTLKNPAAPLQPEFLILPRAGLVLLVGVATTPSSQSSSSMPAKASWMAQWWEFSGAGCQPPQSALLRFGVTCIAVAEDACLVFLGTDEGDVRMFDAGEKPHVGSYCISWSALHSHRRTASMACPITAVAVVPQSVPEVLVATGDGSLVLWSLDKHRIIRTFDCNSPVVSLAWCPSGTHFLGASRSDMTIYSRSSSSALARVVLPGGPCQNVVALQWNVGDLSAVPAENLSSKLGQALVLRSMPDAALLFLTGDGWSQVDTVLSDVAAVVLCGPGNLDAAFGSPSFPSTALAEPTAATNGEESMPNVTQTFALCIQARTNVCKVVCLKRSSTQVWPFAWGSLQLSNISCLQLLPQMKIIDPDDGVGAHSASGGDAKPQKAQKGSEEPSIEWAVRDGVVQDGISLSPPDLPSCPSDGWFVLTGGFEAGGETTNHCGREKLQWMLPQDVDLVECELSFSLDAQVGFISCDPGAEGTAGLLHVDVAEQAASMGDERYEIDLAPGASHCVQFQFDDATSAFRIAIGDCILPWQIQRQQTVGWECCRGELRVRHMFSRSSFSVQDSGSEAFSPQDYSWQSPIQLVETMFAHHVAHYASFVQGKSLPPESREFVRTWALLAGGCRGLFCSGHTDGCIRLWLRSHASVLLLHVLSLQPLASLPWRPCFDPKTGMLLEPATQDVYDGVDSCPAFAAGEAANAVAPVTALDLELVAGAVAAGSSSGEVVLFVWQTDQQTLTPTEAAAWKAQSLVLASQESEAACESQVPELPAGFACSMRLHQHSASVVQLKLTVDAGSLQIVSVDATSHFCVVDCSNGHILFSKSLVCGGSEVSPAKGPPPPPCESLDAIVVSGCVLKIAGTSPKHASAMEINKLKLDLLAKTTPIADARTYLLAFSSGELRQISGQSMDLKLLDNRVSETRLPQLAGGQVLSLFLHSGFLLAIQASGLSIFKREADRLQPGGNTVKFSSRAMGAGVVNFDGELCVYAMLCNGQLNVVALPSLHPVASLAAGNCAGRALKCDSHANQIGVLPGQSFCSDGYFALHCAGAVWIGGAFDIKECRALEASAQAAELAYLLQTLHSPAVSSAEATSEKSSKHPPGILGALFGRNSPKTLRECALPSEPLPAEVDGNRVDQGKGLAPAWQTQAGPQSTPPRSAPQSTRRAAAGVQEALAGATAGAVERGDKISSLADSSRRLADNADQFLDLAKQLNSQQNRWF